MADPPDPIKPQAIEDVMIEAANQCAVEGITDPDIIKQRMLDARAAFVSGGP